MVRVQTSQTVLRICCKSFSIYLKIARVAVRAIARVAGWLENSDVGNREESRRVTEVCSI